MVLARVSITVRRLLGEFERAFGEEYTPHQVAGSFAIGVFVTALPTLGTGLLSFLVIARLTDRVSKIAMFASVLVLNPAVKWGVYGASFWLGSRLLGPLPDVTTTDLSFSMGPEILRRLILGNVLIAIVLTAVGYLAALWLVIEFQRRDVDIVDLVPDAIVE